MKKLLLIGSNAGNAHLSNFLELVRSDFDDVLVVSDYPVNFAPHRHISFSLRNPFKIVNSIRQLREIIEAYDPSIIHVHQVNSYAFISTRANAGKKPHNCSTYVLVFLESDRLRKATEEGKLTTVGGIAPLQNRQVPVQNITSQRIGRVSHCPRVR